MKPIRHLAVLLAAAAAIQAWSAEPLRLDMQSTFNGPLADTTAVTVTLENDGPDARGVLSVSSMQNGTVQYPVELPRGARKKLLTLPGGGWGELRFELQTDRGRVVRSMPASDPGYSPGGAIAYVGDDSGGLAFVRQKTSDKQPIATRDAYVTPEDAPARPVAYRTYGAVTLGLGSERLSDEAVGALKDYAIGGGTLIFVGGASAPVLADARWRPLLPGREWTPKTLADSDTLANLGEAPLPGPFTVLVPGTLAKDARARREGATPIETERGFGLGRIVVLGYSPVEAPLDRWEGRVKTMVRFVRGGDTMRAKQYVEAYLSANSGAYNSMAAGSLPGSPAVMAVGPGASRVVYSPYGVPAPGLNNPFSTQLPPTSAVFGILAAYFVLVVPASFLILRKMKKGELAWFTAPLLSLGFAGVLFKSAEGLYSAALSSATQGVVVLQQGSPDAMFFGTSQLFFPRGGVYDLKLHGVDSLSSVGQDGYGYPGASDLQGFNPIDVGEIVAPQLEANNLAFRDMSYVQRLDGADWFRMEKVDSGHIRVENRSPYSFNGVVAAGPYLTNTVSIPSGGRVTVKILKDGGVPAGEQIPVTDARTFTRSTRRIALTGTLSGFRPGPQIGNEPPGYNGIRVLAFAQETLR